MLDAFQLRLVRLVWILFKGKLVDSFTGQVSQLMMAKWRVPL